MPGYVSEAVIRRLPGYYRHLTELEAEGVVQISSQDLGRRMELTPSQIRQDINCFGGFGRQGYGYTVSELRGHIAEILGLDQRHKLIMVGMGNIGSAIAKYLPNVDGNFECIGMFDIVAGRKVGDMEVQSIEAVEKFINENEVDLAAICVPASEAQDILDRLISCGVKSFWNFAPTDLKHKDNVTVVNVHLSDNLHILSYKMAHKD